MSKSDQCTVIIGAGFTGLFTALYLSHQRYQGQIILIDQSERFTFKPLLFDLLDGQMEADQVYPRYQELLQGSGVMFVQNSVQQVDLNARSVELKAGLQFTYTHLVLALGSVTGYFGTPGAVENSFAFRSGQDAIALRQQLRTSLQQASQTNDPQERQRLLTVAIIGAGPAGIELAATLADSLPHWYSTLGGNPQEIRIVVINRGPKILSGDANEGLRDTALKALQQRVIPVELLLGAPVTALQPSKVQYTQSGQSVTLDAETIIWMAGTATHPLIKDLPIGDENCDKHGRPFITPTLHLIGYPDVFAGGDCVTYQAPQPALAQVAYQQAKAIAHNLIAASAGETLQVGHVSLRGTLMKLGKDEAAADIFSKYKVRGRAGHIIRNLTYLEMLPTPVHNLKITAEWLSDEVLHRAKTTV